MRLVAIEKIKWRKQKTFKVSVDYNFHFMDETERYMAGTFDRFEATAAKCRSIVDHGLQHLHKSGMKAGELFKMYCAFREGPWIEGGQFSAWEYARSKCAEFC